MIKVPRPWLILAVALALVWIVRIRLLDLPLERDEGEYAYVGQLMLQGVPPYQLAYNMKLPGTYAAYALIMAVFGQTCWGIHLGLLLVNAGAILLVTLLGKRLFGNQGGAVAGASYALLSLGQGVLGFAAHATHFVILAALAGTLLLLRGIDSGRRGTIFCSGLLFGLAYVMKQPGILFGVFGAVYLLVAQVGQVPDVRSGLSTEPRLGRPGTCPTRTHKKWLIPLALGWMAPVAATCLALWHAGVWDRFWFWTVTYAREYATALPLSRWPAHFFEQSQIVLKNSFPLWILAAVGTWQWAVGSGRWAEKKRPFSAHCPLPAAHFLGIFLFFSFLAVCPGGFFREHYFVLMLPAVALLVGAARNVPWWLFAAAFLLCFALERDVFFAATPIEASRYVYRSSPFPEAIEISNYIRSHSNKEAQIAVLGSEPEIYFYAHRRSATGYIYVYSLMEPQPYAATMQREMISQIESARPEYLVLVMIDSSWLQKPTSPRLLIDWFNNEALRFYEPVGMADIWEHQTDYRWDAAAQGYSPKSSFAVEVLRRK